MAPPAHAPPVFDALRLSAASLDVTAVNRLGASAIRSRQASRLRALVSTARQRSRFWRERLAAQPGAARGETDLGALPVVTKAELMARFDDWITDPAITRPALRAFMDDPSRVGEAFLGRYVVWESSGTSGTPGVFVQDAQALAVYDALEALRRHALRPMRRLFDPLYLSERLAFVGATGGHFASVVSVERLRRLNPWMGAAFHTLSLMRPVAELVADLNAMAPTILVSYPTAVALLAEQARAGALHIRPEEIWTGGETLTAEVRRHIERSFGCCVRNSYGASEFLAIGWECREGRMHTNADWVILEPVDASFRPVPPGVVSHTTLLTNLANHVQPLLRYDLGDSLCVSPEPCGCGSPLPVIAVQGREDDPLVLHDAHGRHVTWLPLAISTLLEEEAGVFDFQLHQRDKRTLCLRVGLEGDAAHAALTRCQQSLAALARRDGVRGLRIVSEAGQPLQRGSSGKLRRMIRAAP
ncbi:MAG: phenylacetate--CoA ligase family protein [Rhizobacter sp.]|nr:phenylacetate--CoA ligase family protein [Rhizobacter sp.]